MPLSPVAKTSVLVCLSLSLATFGLLMYIMFPRILQWQVEENLVLSPDAEPYEYWRVVPVPILCKFYFFNITNAADILTRNAKPQLQEVGPYTFREAREKINITWHDNGTVSYAQVKRWYYEPSLTKGSLEDLVTTINVPMVSAAAYANLVDDDDFMETIQELLFQLNSTVFVTRPVRTLLFEGYTDRLLVVTKDVGLPVPYEKFGWFYPKNNSYDGIFTIFTGKNNVQDYGRVDKWNGKSRIRGRKPPCDNIVGTAGDMWPPFRKSREEKLELFVPDICSSLGLNYLADVQVNEIDSYRYWLDETSFDNGKYNKFNSCYCKDQCMPSGILDIAECQHGAPAAVSFPHFLYADSKYTQKISGMRPDPDLHKFIIDLEPLLGIPVNVEARLQINIAIPKIDSIKQFQFPEETIYYPVFWFSETASVNLETAEKLKFVTKVLPQYVTIGCFLSVITGFIILVLTLHFAVQRYTKRPSPPNMVYSAVRVVHT